jgi:2-haloacid dehalogenase
LDWNRFEWITFDCYGTLINWEAGILGYLQPLLRSKGCEVSNSRILSLYSELEPREQAGEYRRYRDVLAAVMRGLGKELELQLSEAEIRGLADSIAGWKPFADTVPGLQELKSRYRLGILSNIDDDLFALTAKHLEVPFDLVVTAEQARSYKPSRRNFELLVERLGIAKEKLLHAAESLYHDVAPARELGITTVWVNRRQGRPAAASRLADVKPDFEVATIQQLARLAFSRSATGSRES